MRSEESVVLDEQARQKREQRLMVALRQEIGKGANRILRGQGIEIHVTTNAQADALGIEFRVESKLRGNAPETFDPNELVGDPVFKEEPRHVSGGYVVTERIIDPRGEEIAVYPDEHMLYPASKEDVLVALHHDLYLGARWAMRGIAPEEAALIAHSYRREKAKWLYQAKVSLLATNPDLSEKDAAQKSGTVIEGLIEMHKKRQEHASAS